ncbi:MAG TPA: hypothetical protein VIX91_13160 [Candidatus Acidoferrum sp.]
MRLPTADPTIEISTNSGMLRVTVHPVRSWLVVLLGLGALMVFAAATYEYLARMSQVFRGVFIFAIVSSAIGLIFQLSGTEIIEIDSNKITLRKEVHGWGRKREYEIKECRELEWMEGSEDAPQRLQFKFGWRTITFGKSLTENQAIQILTALQQALPNVAQQLCSHPEGKKHFNSGTELAPEV